MPLLYAWLLVLLTVLASGAEAAMADLATGKTAALGNLLQVRYTDRWKPSDVAYSNAIELVVLRPAAVQPDPQAQPVTTEFAEARVLIAAEPRTSHSDAVKRLSEIARSRDARVRFLEIAGWPALEMEFVEELPKRGMQRAPPTEFAQRGITAIAAGAQLLRFDISLAPGVDRGLLREAQEIARTAAVAERGDPVKARASVQRLISDYTALKRPVQPRSEAVPTPTRTARSGTVDSGTPASGGPATGGSGGLVVSVNKLITELSRPSSDSARPVRVQAGVGELEVATSGDANNVVIASNAAIAFSTDRAQTFNAGNSGVFGLNDPSVSRGVSGNFYLAVIAFPTGTAVQLNVSGCTNAVSRSTDSGATFGLQGYSAQCAASGAGICFPDQEHIAADARNAAGGNDQLYAVWRNFTPVAGAPAPVGTPACRGIGTGNTTASITCSQDNGVNWTARAAIVGAGDFPRVAVARDGTVFAVSLSGNAVTLNRFTSCANGLTADAGFPVTVANLSGQVACPVPGLDRCNNGNTLSSPTVAVDPADANHLFVAFAETDGSGGERIVVHESQNRGASFFRNATISGSASARRFMPWACVTGSDAWVGWYDRRGATTTTNDLTDYYIGQADAWEASTVPLYAGATRNLTNNPDPQCASGWPCGARSANDAEFCSLQPQVAGFCTNAAGTIVGTCDFSGGCPPGQSCQPGGGCPKYGDYNGIACANNYVIAAWTSATAPAGLPAAPGLNVYASAEYVGSRLMDICKIVPGLCVDPSAMEPGLLRVNCKRLPCFVVDPIPENCKRKFPCPPGPPGEPGPPVYDFVFDDTLRPWNVDLVDREGRQVEHEIIRRGRETRLRMRPSKTEYQEGLIGNYSLVFRAGPTIKPRRTYPIRMRLELARAQD